MPETVFPSSVQVKILDQKHPDFLERELAWKHLSILYDSGECIEKAADELLTKRLKEPSEMYTERCRSVSYTNIIGQAAGWYESALFATDPQVDLKRGEKAVDPAAARDKFWDEFQRDCDGAGTSFVNFYHQIFCDLLIYGRAFSLKDLPELEPAETKAQENLKPYLVRYDPQTVTNWATDKYGNLDWCMITVRSTGFTDVFPPEPVIIDRWYYFNRTEFAVYERRYNPGSDPPEDAMLLSSGPHAMSERNVVPVRKIEVPAGLWLGRRAYLPAKKHFNLENGLDWALLQSALALLVIKGTIDQEAVKAEWAYLQLGPDSSAEYLEPSGNTFATMSTRLNELREEIFRAWYLQAQGRSTAATPAAQSGYSKEMDMMPSYEVLAGFGKILGPAMQADFQDIVTIREGENSDLTVTVRGFEFEESDALGELTTIETVKRLDIQSDTLDMELDVKAAHLALPGANPELLDTIEQEIRSGPTRSQRKEQEKKEQMQMFDRSFKINAA